MTEHNWKPARWRPVKVEFRGPYTDPEIAATIDGDFEIDEEYIEEHGGFVIIRGVDGEESLCPLDRFGERYVTLSPSDSDSEDAELNRFLRGL